MHEVGGGGWGVGVGRIDEVVVCRSYLISLVVRIGVDPF